MPKKLKLIIEYDGTKFSGWQIQKNTITIQGEIEYALQKIFNNKKVNVVGAGRTDSGVHARAQAAHIFLDTEMSSEKIRKAINGNLPKEIWIKECEMKKEDFHARYSATIREYRYFISTEYSPLHKNREWYLSKKLDFDVMKNCVKLIKGEHNFTNFCKATAEVKNKICKIFNCNLEIESPKIIFSIRANRYLQHMVRYLVGTIIEVGRGRYSLNQFKNLLNVKRENIHVIRAPAHGLYLWRIEYE